MGHTLYIENNFSLSKEKYLEVVNRYLKTDSKRESPSSRHTCQYHYHIQTDNSLHQTTATRQIH